MQVNDMIVIFAFRYCLGRMSTAPSIMALYLKTVWKKLTPSTRELIVCEINEGLKRGEGKKPGHEHPLGWQCDIDTWREVLSFDVKCGLNK